MEGPEKVGLLNRLMYHCMWVVVRWSFHIFSMLSISEMVIWVHVRENINYYREHGKGKIDG